MRHVNSKPASPWHWLIALVVLGVLLRVGLTVCYGPLSQPDTGTYISAAQDLAAGGAFTRSEGRRTPGYPLFIAALGQSPVQIMSAQLAFGVATSALLYLLALRLTGRPKVAFLAGLSYDINLQQLFFEAILLTEPLTTFLLAAMLLILLAALERLRQARAASILTFMTGLLAGATIMVRPQFIFLPLLLPLLVGYASWTGRRGTSRALGHAALVILPIVVAVAGWMAVVQDKTGYFTLSNQSGFGVVNHSVEFIELAPERYATVRDILLKYRALQVAATGHAGNTVWYAWPEIRQATGWSLPEASRQLQQMSKEMFIQHPLLYAGSVMRPLVEFWTVPLLWAPERIKPGWLVQPIEWLWWVEHKLLRLANLVFLLLVAAVAVSRRMRLLTRWDLQATTISAVVLCSSLLQALADRGAGSRYGVTLQAAIVVLVLVTLARMRANRQPAAMPQAVPAHAADGR